MGEPPSLDGAAKVTLACALPAVAVPIVGAPGRPNGVALLEAADDGPVPTPLAAVTVNVYAVPLASPETVIEPHGAPHVPMKPPGDDVAVYAVIAEPPLLAGAVNVTLACALPAVAVPIVGAPGTVAGVTLFDAAEGALPPTALLAVTVKVYAVPLARPVTVIGPQAAPLQLALNPPGEEVAV
jgi:hypothetical protein